MSEIMSAKNIRKYIIKYDRKESQKKLENMTEKDIKKYIRKESQKIRPKK